MSEETIEACWLDIEGDKLEESGIKPGNIHEWFGFALPKCEPGGLVVTRPHIEEGISPKDCKLHGIRWVIAKEIRTGIVHRMKITRPIVAVNLRNILSSL